MASLCCLASTLLSSFVSALLASLSLIFSCISSLSAITSTSITSLLRPLSSSTSASTTKLLSTARMRMRMRARTIVLLSCVLCGLNMDGIAGINFYLAGSEQKCLSEQLQNNELLIGEFSINPIRIESVDEGVYVSVSDPTEDYVYEKNVDNGKFAFTSPEDGEYVFCFHNSDEKEKRVTFSIHSGVRAKDYSNIVKKENLKPLETKLQRLEDITRETLGRYEEVRQMEDLIHKGNQTVSSTAFWFGIALTLVLAVISFGQMYHLKNFFKKKKVF